MTFDQLRERILLLEDKFEKTHSTETRLFGFNEGGIRWRLPGGTYEMPSLNNNYLEKRSKMLHKLFIEKHFYNNFLFIFAFELP